MGAGPYDLSFALNELVEESWIYRYQELIFLIYLWTQLSTYLKSIFIPDDADVGFESDFLERFLTNDRQDDVHKLAAFDTDQAVSWRRRRDCPYNQCGKYLECHANPGGADLVELIRCTENRIQSF